MRENIPIWRRLRKKSRKCSWYENDCNEGSDKTLPSVTLTIIFDYQKNHFTSKRFSFWNHFSWLHINVRQKYMTSVHSSGASLQSHKDVTLVEETNQARSKARTSRNAFEMLGSRVASKHNTSWPS